MHDVNNRIEKAREALAIEAEGIAFVASRLNHSFGAAIDVLLASERVFVLGVGKSAIIGAKIAATFSSIGKPAHFLHPVDAMHGDIGSITQGSCAIVISKSGTTSELIDVIPFLHQRKIPVIGIVGSTESVIAKSIDVVLDCTIHVEACPLNIAPTTSTTAALAMGDALAVVLMDEVGNTASDFAYHHPAGQLGKNLLMTVKNVMHSGDRMPVVSSLVSMREALIANSTHGMGCVCVVNADAKLTGIITDGDIRRLLQYHENILELSVEDVMTTRPVCATPDMTLHEALQLMENRQSQISVLPVVSPEGECVGVLRIHDILRS